MSLPYMNPNSPTLKRDLVAIDDGLVLSEVARLRDAVSSRSQCARCRRAASVGPSLMCSMRRVRG